MELAHSGSVENIVEEEDNAGFLLCPQFFKMGFFQGSFQPGLFGKGFTVRVPVGKCQVMLVHNQTGELNVPPACNNFH